MEVKAEDEYLHFPASDNPLWWENYQFNGYDPVRRIGISIYTAIKPVLGFKEDYIIIHKRPPLFFRKQRKLSSGNTLELGSLKMESLQILRKWRIRAKDFFQRTENGNPSNITEDVKFDLCFDSDKSPYGFTTERGDRYEQPGLLKGEIGIGEKVVDFEGRGIRDHSWEIRNILGWGEWFWHMGCFESGEALSFTYMKNCGQSVFHGWRRTDNYCEIRNIQLDPTFSGAVLKECHMEIETSRDRIEVNSKLISFVSIPIKEDLSKRRVIETLVELDKGKGYGFLWYGR
jgi:hypothetical protein